MKVLRSTVAVVGVLVLVSCAADVEETPTELQTEDVGFEARITGAYEGDVAGPGVLLFLPDAGFERQGYFFIADAQGLRPNGVTLVLPPGLTPGRHVLESPAPLDIGTVPSVRVDRDMGTSITSFQERTAGFVDLTEFPDDPQNLTGALVSGSFEFETDGPEGQMIVVGGEFSFEVE